MSYVPEKLVVDQREITFRELGDVEDVLGVALADAFTRSQSRAMAALAWVTARRDQPDLSFEDVLDWPMGIIERREDDVGEAAGSGNGSMLLPSPEHGPSTLPTSSTSPSG